VVTGQYRPQPADRSVYEIRVIDQKDIRLKAASTLGEVLRTEPGFQVRSEGVLGDYVRIRGLSGEHVKILVDGMPVTGRIADRIDLGQLTLNNVDHIEIVEGPMSVVYGSNALAGAINIITADHSDRPWHASANGYYESAGIYNLNAQFSRTIKNQSIGFNVARNFFTGWGPIDSSRYRVWKPKLQYMAGADYRLKTQNLKLAFFSDYLHEELRDPGALTLANLYEKALDGYHFTTRWNNRLNLTTGADKKIMFNLQAGYSYYEKKKNTYLNDLVNLHKTLAADADLHDTTRFNMVSARGFISNKPGGKVQFQTGIDVNYESADGKRTGGQKDMYDLSAFGGFIYAPFQKLSIQPGLRLMHNSNYKAPVIYGVTFKYGTENLVLRTSYARGFRAPSLKQLYLEFIDNNHEIHGNPELKPETADNVSASATYTVYSDRRMIAFETSVFYNSIKDAVQLAISTQKPGWGKYFNVPGLFKTMGAEAGFTFRYSPRLMLNSTITATGRNRIDENNSYSWSTDFVTSATVKLPRPGLQLAVFYKYTDRYLDFAGNYNPEGQLDGIVQELTSSYHTLDATLSRSFMSDQLFISTGLKNIFNVTLIDSPGNLNFHGSVDNSAAIGYGRVFFVNAIFTFDKN
jgi:outer membrane receptor for ferrienterochelin and colicins